MKKILFFLAVILLIVLFLAVSKNIPILGDGIFVQQNEIEFKSNDILNLPLNTKLNSNAVVYHIARDAFYVYLYLDDISGMDYSNLDPKNFFAYLEIPNSNKNRNISGEVEAQSIGGTGKNVALSLVMDYSGSMFDNKAANEMRKAVYNFINNYQTDDISEIIKFGSSYYNASNFTNNQDYLRNSISKNHEPMGGTAFYSAINLGISNLSRVNANDYVRAIVAFSDGGDNESDITDETVIKRALKNNIPIFTIGLYGADFNKDILYNISNKTGGFCHITPNATKLTELYNRINSNIRNSYYLKIKWLPAQLPQSGTQANLIIRYIENNYALAEYKKYNLIIP